MGLFDELLMQLQMQQLPQMAEIPPGLLGANGLLGNLAAGESSQLPGLLNSQLPQGFANTMEAGITDTGYTPSSLWNAFRNASPENGTGLGQNLINWGSQKATEFANGSMANRFFANMDDPKERAKMEMGLGMMRGRPPPQMPRGGGGGSLAHGPQGPLGLPYGGKGATPSVTGIGNMDRPQPGESFADFLRRKAMMRGRM